MCLTLSEEEKAIYSEYVKNYCDCKNPDEDINVDNALRVWNEKKERLYKLLGNNLILEKKVDFSCNKDDEKREEAFSLTKHKFLKSVKDAIGNENFKKIFSEENLINNYYGGEESVYIEIKGKKFAFHHGQKIIKRLGKIAKVLDNLGDYENFRIEHSLLLQKTSFKGTLCLSIHPLDFLTLSDNNYNWTSCLSVINNGAYSAGTIETMNSDKVIIAYLKGDKDFYLTKNYKWNGKKWRKLFIADKSIIMGVKGYPYEVDNNIDKMIIDWIAELSEKNLGDSYDEEYGIYNEDKAQIEVSNKTIYKNVYFLTNSMFNDINCSGLNYPIKINEKVLSSIEKKSFYYSEDLTCLKCGNYFYLDESGDKDSYLCENCGDYYYCDICGHYEKKSNGVNIDNKHICSWCYDDYCTDFFTKKIIPAHHIKLLTITASINNRIVQTQVSFSSIEELLSLNVIENKDAVKEYSNEENQIFKEYILNFENDLTSIGKKYFEKLLGLK